MAEEIFCAKRNYANGDILDIRIYRVPQSAYNPEGVAYTLAFIRNGIRVIGYDDFHGHAIHGNRHHKHTGDHIKQYRYVDEWKLVEDFLDDVDKFKRRNP